jgi:antitoxin component YwqK of YwqJK toxin-antitoxin module
MDLGFLKFGGVLLVMKKLLITFFTILFCLTSSVGYSHNIICEKTGNGCPEIDFKELVLRDDKYYKKFSNESFTGKVNGQEQGSLKNGKKDGSWIGYHENGQLFYEGDWKNGKKDGSWVYYTNNGLLSHKKSFKNGKREGSYQVYHNNSYFLKYKGQYKDDLKEGYWVVYWENGKFRYKGNYKNGKGNGLWLYYYNNGQLSLKGNMKNGKEEGYWVCYFENGTKDSFLTGVYKDGKKISD